jgi:hypothetical protein
MGRDIKPLPFPFLCRTSAYVFFIGDFMAGEAAGFVSIIAAGFITGVPP